SRPPTGRRRGRDCRLRAASSRSLLAWIRLDYTLTPARSLQDRGERAVPAQGRARSPRGLLRLDQEVRAAAGSTSRPDGWSIRGTDVPAPSSYPGLARKCARRFLAQQASPRSVQTGRWSPSLTTDIRFVWSPCAVR